MEATHERMSSNFCQVVLVYETRGCDCRWRVSVLHEIFVWHEGGTRCLSVLHRKKFVLSLTVTRTSPTFAFREDHEVELRTSTHVVHDNRYPQVTASDRFDPLPTFQARPSTLGLFVPENSWCDPTPY